MTEKRRIYMKRKYYLRGVGVGILFATIILFIAYSAMGRKAMSDEEVMKRAEELGMVKAGSLLDSLNRSSEDSTDNSVGDSSTDSNSATEPATENPSSVEPTTTEAEPTTQDTEADEPSSTTSPTERTVKFTVVSGMSSWNVATILQDQGVIADAADFDNYLEANGYSDRISTGEYTVTVGSDYETIARLITGG